MQREELFPLELVADVPRITLCGKTALHVEQHKGLLAYQQEDITLLTGVGSLRIQGKELCFRRYSAAEAVICGEIDSVCIGEAQR